MHLALLAQRLSSRDWRRFARLAVVLVLSCVTSPSSAAPSCDWVWAMPVLRPVRERVFKNCNEIASTKDEKQQAHCGCTEESAEQQTDRAYTERSSISPKQKSFAPCPERVSVYEHKLAEFLDEVMTVVATPLNTHWRVRALRALRGDESSHDTMWWRCWWNGPYLVKNIMEQPRNSRAAFQKLLSLGDYRAWTGNATDKEEFNLDKYYFVTAIVGANDVVYWLGRKATRWVKLEPEVVNQADRPGLRYLILPRDQTDWLIVEPGGHEQQPPLVFDVNQGLTEIDTLSPRRTFLVHVVTNASQSVAIDGYPSVPEPTGSHSPVEWQIVAQKDASPSLVVYSGQQISSVTKIDHDVYHDFSGSTVAVGLLPISLTGCQAYGVDESRVTQRAKDMLDAWKIQQSDLGMQAAVAKGYIAAAHGSDDNSGANEPLRGSIDTSEQLSAFLRDLFNQGFERLLDLRLTCSRTPAGEDVFSVSAVLVTLRNSELNGGTMDSPEFLTTTKVVKGLDRLNVATSAALATLLKRNALVLGHTPNEIG